MEPVFLSILHQKSLTECRISKKKNGDSVRISEYDSPVREDWGSQSRPEFCVIFALSTWKPTDTIRMIKMNCNLLNFIEKIRSKSFSIGTDCTLLSFAFICAAISGQIIQLSKNWFARATEARETFEGWDFGNCVHIKIRSLQKGSHVFYAKLSNISDVH